MCFLFQEGQDKIIRLLVNLGCRVLDVDKKGRTGQLFSSSLSLLENKKKQKENSPECDRCSGSVVARLCLNLLKLNADPRLQNKSASNVLKSPVLFASRYYLWQVTVCFANFFFFFFFFLYVVLALHIACGNQYQSTVQTLLENGAKDTEDNNGNKASSLLQRQSVRQLMESYRWRSLENNNEDLWFHKWSFILQKDFIFFCFLV